MAVDLLAEGAVEDGVEQRYGGFHMDSTLDSINSIRQRQPDPGSGNGDGTASFKSVAQNHPPGSRTNGSWLWHRLVTTYVVNQRRVLRQADISDELWYDGFWKAVHPYFVRGPDVEEYNAIHGELTA